MNWEDGVTMSYDGIGTFTFTDAKGNTAVFNNDSVRDLVVSWMCGPGSED